MRIFLIVIDSFGIGAMPDAADFGDLGSDTYGNLFRETGVRLPNMVSYGLNNIDGVAKAFPNGKSLCPVPEPRAAYARLGECTKAKDTTAGHYEIAGLVMQRPYRIYPKFPPEVLRDLERETGRQFLGNEAASGTEIIRRLGEEHRRTGKPILYTSQDSVMQIAADTSVIPLQELYRICEAARRIMQGDRAVGRIIARPFVKQGDRFVRTEDRRDYALEPPGTTMLDTLHAHGVRVTAVGKISDLFCGRGITESIHTGNNGEGLDAVLRLTESVADGLVFVNLVDTDMLFGHRNDVPGYAKALRQIDERIPAIERGLRCDDVLILTADHGCDPTTASTDHSREYVPLLLYGKSIRPQNLHTLQGFDHIARFVCAAFGCGQDPEIFDRIVRR